MKDFIHYLLFDNDIVKACIVVVLFGLALYAAVTLVTFVEQEINKNSKE
jgi:hypothetical protein